ncbi:hypothetical protein [Joostella sp. CR20]|uniref:hypothetical protein n=1 Tax=Joostella sp. CR20 TaxID=2804312 RepID=UPI00313CC592
MLKRILSYIKEGNSYSAIELYLKDETEMFSISSFKNTKEGLEQDFYHQDAMENFDATIVPKKKAFLIINTNNVLTKIEEGTEVEEGALVHKAFPNLKLNEFFYEITNYKNSQLISICRKLHVNKCLEFFKRENILITGFSLGVSNISIVIPFINASSFYLRDKEVTVHEEGAVKIQTREYTERQYDVQGIILTEKELLSFANTLVFIKGIDGSKSNFRMLNEQFREDGIHGRLFSLLLKAGIVFLLTTLAINFLFFTYYYSEIESLRQSQQVNMTNKSKITELTQTIKNKEKMIDDMILSSSSKVSYYIDKLVYEMPEEILLNTINYQPLLKDIKEDKEIQIQKNELIVSGISSESKVFSTWIEALEAYNWITKVEITSYNHSQEMASEFSVLITIRDEK